MANTTIHIIASAKCDVSKLSEIQKRPNFRKATRHMCLAYESFSTALQGADLTSVPPERLGLILASSHGELPVTLEFLKTLAISGVARPLLFQNSLHNSTTGFLSLTFKISGPAITVSNLYFSGESALQTASTLLEGKICDVCIVTGVESAVDLFAEGHELEGSATLVLCSESARRTYGFQSRAILNRVSTNYGPGADRQPSAPSIAYHADALERVIDALGASCGKSEIVLVKRDGSQSLLELELL